MANDQTAAGAESCCCAAAVISTSGRIRRQSMLLRGVHALNAHGSGAMSQEFEVLGTLPASDSQDYELLTCACA